MLSLMTCDQRIAPVIREQTPAYQQREGCTINGSEGCDGKTSIARNVCTL